MIPSNSSQAIIGSYDDWVEVDSFETALLYHSYSYLQQPTNMKQELLANSKMKAGQNKNPYTKMLKFVNYCHFFP